MTLKIIIYNLIKLKWLINIIGVLLAGPKLLLYLTKHYLQLYTPITLK